MPTSELNITDRESAERATFAQASTEGEDVLATEINDKQELAAQWDSIVDRKLIEWGSSRSEFDVEGLVGPSNDAIGTAYKFVKYMRNQDWPLPTGVIPDGEGGIVLENRRDPMYQRMEIDMHGGACLATFRQYKLVDRVPIHIE